MITLTSFNQFTRRQPHGCMLAAGFFDGVHLGHQKVIANALQAANRLGVEAWAMTFDRHPMSVVNPQRKPPLLTSTSRRIELLAETGLHGCLVLPFNLELANLTPDQFIRHLLGEAISVHTFFCGANWRFGKQGSGTPETISSLGRQRGFSVAVVPGEIYRGRPISSTRIRRTIQTGHLGQAADMLGRPYVIRESVIRGRGLGRQLGVATANLHPEAEVLPPTGVYAATTMIGGRQFGGVANLGFRPTFAHTGDNSPTLELHLFEFAGDLYNKVLDIALVRRLRPEQRFATPEELLEQIKIDMSQAKRCLKQSYHDKRT